MECPRRPDVSIVLGSLNRCNLLKQSLRSIRTNGFSGTLEIIVVDGGSRDGTCRWLAQQRNVLTLVQPNYQVAQPDGLNRRAHTWGEFMNLGFRLARAPWILMISDDLLVCPGAIQQGLEQLRDLQRQGIRVGGGAMYWREYPRDRDYHVKLLPGGFAHVNHGFFWKEALAAVGYADETGFEFYGADGDLTMRLNLAGWGTVALDNAFAEHLNHRVRWRRLLSRRGRPESDKDMEAFERRYGHLGSVCGVREKTWRDSRHTARIFWRADCWGCIEGILRRQFYRG
jgi:glycosyltransferase involved in cell wall biosynthesis